MSIPYTQKKIFLKIIELNSPFFFNSKDHLPLPAQLSLVKASVLTQLSFDYTVLGFPVSQDNLSYQGRYSNYIQCQNNKLSKKQIL